MFAGSLLVVPDYDVYAFDRATGNLKWRFDPAAQGAPGYAPGAYGIASDDSGIYTGSGSGHVYALDAPSGSLRWTATLAADSNSSVFDPIVDASTVYVRVTHFTNPLTGLVVAIDKATGAVRWSRSFSPTVPSASDVWSMSLYADELIAAVEDGTVRAVDKTTGVDRWTAPRLPGLTGRDDGRSLATVGDVIVAGSDALVVTGYDARTGAQLWQTNANQGSAISPISTDGRSAYVVFANGRLGAFDGTSGSIRWIASAPSGYNGFVAYPYATEGAVYAPSVTGLIAIHP